MISTHILSSKVHKIMDNTPLQFQKIFQSEIDWDACNIFINAKTVKN